MYSQLPRIIQKDFLKIEEINDLKIQQDFI